MKKKLLLFITAVITLGFASCSEDECDHKIPVPNDLDIAGNWYEEAENEEMRLNENGTFYDKYCNVLRSGETEGRWEYDKANKKLTQTYSFMGQTQFSDWTVKDLTEKSFIIYSTTVAEHKLEKIVETYNMEVGGTADIQYSTNVTSYTSKNERLASVTADGKITAEGEKGTTYIKVATDNGNVWVKVVVGEECFDLWYDYVSVIGMDYTNMRNTLNRIGEPVAGNDGYSFAYINDKHDIIDITDVLLNQQDGLVSEIHLILKESVPESIILAYMNAHYYKVQENGDNIIYSTKESKEDSKTIITYNKVQKTVLFSKNESEKEDDNIKIYHEGLNLTIDQIISKFGEPSFSTNSFLTYEENSDYVNRVLFSINNDTQKCRSVMIVLKEGQDKDKIIEYMNKRYFAAPLDKEGYYYWYNGTSYLSSDMTIGYAPANGNISFMATN